jgi:selenide, water dikinase
LGPEDLDKALKGLPLTTHPNLIVGMDRVEDAGVFKLTDDLAVVQTVDFFTPVVDDPFTFGQIAVANSLSDVYAMGGKPLTAMNIVCFPIQTMDISILHEILKGGLDKMKEAEVVLLGGHSVDDQELKYGLSVTGTIDPRRILRKEGSRPGDQLIMTKPLGTGIISTAVKGELASREATDQAAKSMATLNRRASEVMQKIGVHACTDITGFGLLGHASEMIENTDIGMIINAGSVPFFAEAMKLADMGLIPAGLYKNRDFRKAMIEFEPGVSTFQNDILFDPQTSGGLLMAVPPEKADRMLDELHAVGVTSAAIIGEITDSPRAKIMVKTGK